jgi:hypothetical protein
MTAVELVGIHEETPTEAALAEWFAKQSLASLDTLEAAARTILGLVTALIGALFGVLTVASDKLPAYLGYVTVRVLGVVSVVGLMTALIGALGVLLPSEVQVSSHRPDEQAQAFEKLCEHKSRWLKAAVIAFGVGVDALGLVLIVALSAAA